MDKLSLNPSKIRGYGNILEEKTETDASLLYSHLYSIGRENVGGISSKVFVMEYINSDLYFSDYSLLCIKGEDYTFKVTSTSTGDVSLYDGSTLLDTETISSGVATFEDISFSTTGLHTLYATKSSVKSGNIIVNVIEVDSITGGFMMAGGINSTHTHETSAYIDPQTYSFQLLDANNSPLANVPVSVTVGSGSAMSKTSDANGYITLDFTGHGTGDTTVTIVAGSTSQTFTVYDVEYGLYNGRTYGAYDYQAAKATGTNYAGASTLWFQEEGFMVYPTSTDTNSSWLCGEFEGVTVDFTYLANVGHFPINFIVVKKGGSESNIVAQFIYQSSLGKYGLYCMQNGSYSVKYTNATPLNRNDHFSVTINGGSISIKRNGSSLISGTTKIYTGKLAYGFAVASGQSNTYDKFMIRPSSTIVVPTVSSVGLVASSQSIYVDGSCILSAMVSMSDSSSASGKVVSFYDDDTLLGTGTCDGSGIVNYTYLPSATGSRSIKAVCESVESSAVSVTVSKKSPTITLASSSANVSLGGSYTLSGNLSFGGFALASATVKLYKSGGTLVDTLTTDSTGNYSKSFTGSETTTYYAIYEGTTVYNNVTSSNVTVTVGKTTPTVTISTSSASVRIGDTYTISGTVTYGGTGISGATVKLYSDVDGLVDTLTTNSNGEYSKSITAGGVEEISYYVVFEETTSYAQVTSSSVSVNVGKVLTSLTLATSSASVDVGGTFTLSGVLIDANNTPLSNQVVSIYEHTEGWINGGYTGNDGSFSVSVASSDLGTGSFSFYASYNGDYHYNACLSSDVAVTISPVTPTISSITLTSDKSVLSYADSESATLSATVLDSSSNPVQGATVEFFKGSTSLGTASTNSSGVATKTYASAGVGDVSFTAAVGSLVSETYDVEDCINYDAMTSNSGKWTIPSACSTAYDSNGAKFGTATSYSQVKLTDKLTAPCSVEFTLVDYHSDWNDSASVIIYQYTGGDSTPNQELLIGGFYTKSSFTVCGTTISHTIVKGAKYKIEYGSSTVKAYENNTLLASTSNNVGLPTKFELHVGVGGNRWVKVKDVKIKPL